MVLKNRCVQCLTVTVSQLAAIKESIQYPQNPQNSVAFNKVYDRILAFFKLFNICYHFIIYLPSNRGWFETLFLLLLSIRRR